MAITYPLDIEQVGAVLAGAVQKGFAKSLDVFISVIRAERTEVIKAVDKDMNGMREQIKANGMALLPILRPELRKVCLDKSNPRYPTLEVITGGVAGQVRAVAILGDASMNKKAMFIYGNFVATTGEALQDLLDVTTKLVQERIFGTKYMVKERQIRIAGGGGYYETGDQVPLTPEDEIWWGKYTPPPPFDPIDDAFNVKAIDTGYDSDSSTKGIGNGSFKMTPDTSFGTDTSYDSDSSDKATAKPSFKLNPNTSFASDATNDDRDLSFEDHVERLTAAKIIDLSFADDIKYGDDGPRYGMGINMNGSGPRDNGSLNGSSNTGGFYA